MESLRERIIKNILGYKKVNQEVIEKIDKEFKDFQDFKDNLIKNDIVSEEDILFLLSREHKIPYLDLDKYTVPEENKNLLSQEIALRYKVLPISKIGEVLTLATSNPLDVLALDDLKLATVFKKIDSVLAKEDKIIRALNILYSKDIPSELKEESEPMVSIKQTLFNQEAEPASLARESKSSPIVRAVDLIIYEGLKRRASDIHIEPTQEDLSVRYRIDGVLQYGLSLPKRNQSAILARLKIMASLSIIEFRIPQDGRFKVKMEGREIDFRVSSLPTNFGEKIVLRILDRESLSSGIKSLGFSGAPLRLFEQALESPFGIILVTGPTGSGKSTTLYSILTQINTPGKNIITIEDPVEYQIEGITQIQVRPSIGLGFAPCLRSVLRQSPDIIMVGEIRDSETADIAIKASLTGELIFSTLHTNDSVGAITRLVDMGVEPFLVASSLVISTAQRLVRKLCPRCKLKEKIDKKLLEKLGFEEDMLFKPIGCKHCNNSGYHGRTALLEVLSIDDTIREMIIRRVSESQILEYAKKKFSFTSLKENGFKKCIEGVTSLEEVLRVAG
ncbi:MAG: GspE/PulE family protein [Candidatus Omnitrophica bacterium]|nr:GspE/PulE family protein [Candidatus Omnitrophota bacterium]